VNIPGTEEFDWEPCHQGEVAISSEEPKIVAIIKRNSQGELEVAQDVYVSKNDVVALVSTSGGVVAVVGPISDEDEPVLERLLGKRNDARQPTLHRHIG
jgi:hypothetical protein